MINRPKVLTRFDEAFVNYMDLTALLRADLTAMLSVDTSEPHWRRNFVRASIALIEGHAHCLRSMCAVGLRVTQHPPITAKERKVLLNEAGFDSLSRIKFTLRAAYKLFDLRPIPSFDGQGWRLGQSAIRKRHRLMHPKNGRDLGMSDSTWRAHRRGIIWLIEQFFQFMALAQQKYGR